MSVLLYSKVFWPMIGGVETYTRLLAEGLASRGSDQVTVATAASGPAELPGSKAHVVRGPGLREVWRLIRRSDAVLLAGPTLVPLTLSLLARKPVAIEHHGYQACCPNGLLLYQPSKTVCPERFLRGAPGSCIKCNWTSMGPLRSIASLALTFLRRWMCRHAAVNICVSQHVSKRVQLPNSQVIYHGVPAEGDAHEARRGSGDGESMVFAYVGRLVCEKGVPVLLEAASMLKKEEREFKLRIIGDGPERRECERLIRCLNLADRIEITGFLTGDRLHQALEDVSVVVMPSIGEEAAGLSAISQMMRGRAVIAADIGGLSEVVGEAGLKFTPGDPASLAHQMRMILECPGFVDEIGSRSRDRALQLFRREQMIESHMSVFRAIAKERTSNQATGSSR